MSELAMQLAGVTPSIDFDKESIRTFDWDGWGDEQWQIRLQANACANDRVMTARSLREIGRRVNFMSKLRWLNC